MGSALKETETRKRNRGEDAEAVDTLGGLNGGCCLLFCWLLPITTSFQLTFGV